MTVHILHVLSQHEVTGAETYAATLIAEQAREGHRVTLVSDTLNTAVEAEYVPMRIGQRDYAQRLRNVMALRGLIRARAIDLVHAHSRAASWVSFFATRLSRAPLVSSLHILQSPHLSARLFSVYGEQVISVAGNVRAHAVRVLGLPERRMHLVRNGVDVRWMSAAPSRAAARRRLGLPESAPVVVLVGRLSGHRTKVALSVVAEAFPRIRERFDSALLVVVGGMRMPDDFPALVAATNRRLGADAVRHVGHQRDVVPFDAAADVVVAAGRSAIEALALGRAVVATGEACHVGIVSTGTVDPAMETNFGDFAADGPPEPARVADDVVALLGDPVRRQALEDWGRAFARHSYDVRATWTELREIYREALAFRAVHPGLQLAQT
ncbi:MAG TPA: glycosyltransferase [Gemmatimonadales bacterium]|nr:glycosyltransferase [Gemmatimonadales bacterium]